MKEPTFTVTPSFIYRLIRHSRNLNSERDVILAYSKLADLAPRKLDDHDADIISNKGDKSEEDILFSNISEKLMPLARELYALVNIPEHDGDQD